MTITLSFSDTASLSSVIWLSSQLESELLYDWRFTANQFVLAPSPFRLTASIFSNWTFAVIFLMQHSLWREDGSVVYNCCWTSAAKSFSGPSPAGLMAIFYCLRLQTPQPGGPGFRIYIPQGQGGQVMSPGTGFPFRRLLRFSGLRWRYLTPLPHGCDCRVRWCPRDIASARTA
jgi:hypothetical protein